MIISVRILVGLLALWITSILLSKVGLYGVEGSKLVCLFKMCLNGLLSVIVYVVVTLYLKVPQSIFHFQLKKNRVYKMYDVIVIGAGHAGIEACLASSRNE